MSNANSDDDHDDYLPPPPKARPGWVKLGLWGVPDRASAWAYCAITVLLAALSPVLVSLTGNELFYLGVGFLLSAAWYAAAIRWVDRNGGWG